ncbi:MAG: Ig-like domain-containing protein [Ferruginibacter sp.]|nr:Ig-like domain-containing protein [Ferruginibacter sp.]
MRPKHFFFTLILLIIGYALLVGSSGCGQIGMPTGGPRDSIPPELNSASPALKSTNVTGNKITLSFNEYVEVKDAQTNVLVSPMPKKNPSVDYKLKTVTIKLKDSLLPNTTYSINFGNAIVDVNEGNVLKGFTYVFSTGNKIDSLTLSGKVIIAETGKADSTLLALLYRTADDSSVQKRKPDYIARLKGDGSFEFVKLPAGNFKIYALKDGDGGYTYNSKKELFAFIDSNITVTEKTEPVTLYASALEKESKTPATKPTAPAKKLLLTQVPTMQDLLSPLLLSFNNPLKKIDTAKLILTDTNYKPIPATAWSVDSSHTKLSLAVNWQPGMQYRLVVDTSATSDSANNHLAKQDTLRITAKTQEDYGNVVFRFSNLDLAKHPVLQFVQGDEIKNSYPVSAMEWSNKFINPGEYDIRILYDDNNNGKWDPGNYSIKLQPEKVISLSQKLAVKANWDNERDIKL